MSEAETANILTQVVNGLLYLKVNNILHRDMSLSNLLLTKDLKVKISDFGLATQLTRSDEKHLTLCGTPNYISPEVASRASHGLPVDVWGLGCMMYTLLVGKPPFDTDGVKSTLTRVVMADFVVPTYLSMEARDLLDRLLRKNPTERLHIEEVLSHPFMLKYLVASTPKYNMNTIASVDSGLMTMSSGTISTQNITGKIGIDSCRSRTDDQNMFKPNVYQTNKNVLCTTNSVNTDSSLHAHIAEYNGFQNQKFGADTQAVTNRFENMALLKNESENSLFGGCSERPATNSYQNGVVPPRANAFYGNQENYNYTVKYF